MWGMELGRKPSGVAALCPGSGALSLRPWTAPLGPSSLEQAKAGAFWNPCPGACEQGQGPPSRPGLPLQVWQCGGSMEVLPCSRVAHIERTKKPYNNDIDYYAKRNALRAAEVWMDSFKSHVYMAWNIPMTVRLAGEGGAEGERGGAGERGWGLGQRGGARGRGRGQGAREPAWRAGGVGAWAQMSPPESRSMAGSLGSLLPLPRVGLV